MLNIFCNKNANQSYNEVSPHTGQNGHHQKIYKHNGKLLCNTGSPVQCCLNDLEGWDEGAVGGRVKRKGMYMTETQHCAAIILQIKNK